MLDVDQVALGLGPPLECLRPVRSLRMLTPDRLERVTFTVEPSGRTTARTRFFTWATLKDAMRL